MLLNSFSKVLRAPEARHWKVSQLKCWELKETDVRCGGKKKNTHKSCSFTTSQTKTQQRPKSERGRREAEVLKEKATVKKYRRRKKGERESRKREGWRLRWQNSRGSSSDLIKWFSPECLGGGGGGWSTTGQMTSSLHLLQLSQRDAEWQLSLTQSTALYPPPPPNPNLTSTL